LKTASGCGLTPSPTAYRTTLFQTRITMNEHFFATVSVLTMIVFAALISGNSEIAIEKACAHHANPAACRRF
jgi:hypothetical protein